MLPNLSSWDTDYDPRFDNRDPGLQYLEILVVAIVSSQVISSFHHEDCGTEKRGQTEKRKKTRRSR